MISIGLSLLAVKWLDIHIRSDRPSITVHSVLRASRRFPPPSLPPSVSVVIFHAWRNRKSVTAAFVILVDQVVVWTGVTDAVVDSTTTTEQSISEDPQSRNERSLWTVPPSLPPLVAFPVSASRSLQIGFVRQSRRCHMRKTHSRRHRRGRGKIG